MFIRYLLKHNLLLLYNPQQHVICLFLALSHTQREVLIIIKILLFLFFLLIYLIVMNVLLSWSSLSFPSLEGFLHFIVIIILFKDNKGRVRVVALVFT